MERLCINPATNKPLSIFQPDVICDGDLHSEDNQKLKRDYELWWVSI